MKNDQETEVTDEVIERSDLAYKLAKEVVEHLKLPDIKEYQIKDYKDTNHYFYKIDKDFDILLYAQIKSIFGHINFDFSLGLIAHNTILLFQGILSDETSAEVIKPTVIYEMKKRNVDALTLFDLKESETQEFIEVHTKGVLFMFIANLSDFTQTAVLDAYEHSKIGHYNHNIKPMMKKHWEKLGLPEDFELITKNQLDEVRKYDLGLRRWFTGDKKHFFNESVLQGLADEADRLKKQYQEAKKRYVLLKNSFYILNKNAANAEWQEKWMELRSEEFFNLFFATSDELEKLRPFELARNHLAFLYGYDDEWMKKKIAKSRSLKKQKNKKGSF